MTKEKEGCCEDEKEWKNKKWHSRHGHNGAGGGIYCLAFIGAFVYYLNHADTFWIGVLGFFKALLWPAFLLYKVYEILKF